MTPSFQQVSAMWDYCPQTGHITYASLGLDYFADSTNPEESCAEWNSDNFGSRAESGLNERYLRLVFFGKKLMAHRVAWCLHNGSWPTRHIDHINGDSHDNRIANLREVTVQENLRNAKLYVTNSSGFVGVSYEKNRGKWCAEIKIDGRSIKLGRFSEKSDAVAARAAAEKKYGFHENHGRKS